MSAKLSDRYMFLEDDIMKRKLFLAAALLILSAAASYSVGIDPAPKPEYVPGEIIVKFKSSVKMSAVQLNSVKPDAANITNFTSINGILAKHKLNKLKKTFKVSDAEKIKRKFPKRTLRTDKKAKTPVLSNIHTLTFPENADIKAVIEELKKDPNVEYAEPNYINHTYAVPNDTYYNSSGAWGQSYRDMWGLQKISAEAAWNTCTGNSNIIVAVVDTGLDYNHEDIAANVWSNSDEIPGNGIDDDGNGFIDDIRGWNFAAGTNDPMDDHGHGSHCAGTIAGVGNNAKGVVGVTWSCKIMPIKGLAIEGGWDDDLANSVIYAAENGADVISNSWGPTSRRPDTQLFTDAFNYAYSLGCVLVAAAGNSNDDASYYSPANIPCVLTVAASDQNDAKCSFSNWGTVIDVAAPGGGSTYNILSLRSASGIFFNSNPQYVVGTKYGRLGGTSMACPHVAGLAALILSNKPTLTNAEVEQIIKSSTDDLGDAGFDIYFGYGRINAQKALGGLFIPPVMSQTPGNTDGNYVVSWDGASHESGIACYELQEKYSPLSFYDDLESGPGQWTLSGFSLSSARSKSGTMCAFSGNAINLNNSMVSTSSFEVTSNSNTLSFWCYYGLETGYDYAYLDVSTNKVNWSNLATYNGSQPSWQKRSYSLSSYIGQRVYVRLRYVTDSSINDGGFYVDDVCVAGSGSFSKVSDNITNKYYSFADKSGGNYEYMARARNNVGNWSGWSATMSVIVNNPDKTSPSAPVLDSIRQDPNGRLGLSWSAATDESGIARYELQSDNIGSFDDAEENTLEWRLSGFTRSTQRYNSPTHSYFSGSGNDLATYMETVSSLEISSVNALLDFWCWYDLETSYDYVYLEASTDRVNWNVLDAYNGLRASWEHHGYSLSQYNGSSVYLRFRLYSDFIVNRENFYVDDITVSDYEQIDDQIYTTNYNVNVLHPGRYSYRVRARDNNNNWSAWSNTESATVVISGYTIHDPVTNVTVFVPFTTSTIEPTITIEANADSTEDLPGPPPANRGLSGSTIDFISDISLFSGPIQITIPYSASDSDPRPYYWDPALSQWRNNGLIITGTANGLLTFTTNHLSIYGIFGSMVHDLKNTAVYPNPYKIGTPPNGVIFDNLPVGSTVRIFTIAGDLVMTGILSASTTWTWDIKNHAGNRCARGIYIYLIFSPDGKKKMGKIAIID
jgi:hypothetical protein